jgi:hypothetical protein
VFFAAGAVSDAASQANIVENPSFDKPHGAKRKKIISILGL